MQPEGGDESWRLHACCRLDLGLVVVVVVVVVVVLGTTEIICETTRAGTSTSMSSGTLPNRKPTSTLDIPGLGGNITDKESRPP